MGPGGIRAAVWGPKSPGDVRGAGRRAVTARGLWAAWGRLGALRAPPRGGRGRWLGGLGEVLGGLVRGGRHALSLWVGVERHANG